MKRLGLLLMCVAAMAMTSCGSLGSSSNAAAVTAGNTCGSAVQGLYKSYKSTNTIDLSNATNLSNALVVATSYSQLKANKDDSNYKRSFINGMVASAGGLLTTATATNFVNQMLASSGLSGLNSSNITKTANTVSTLVQLMQIIKQ